MDRHETRRALERLVDAWEQAGLPADPLAPVSAAFGRIAEMAREAATIPGSADVTRALAARLAAGEMSLEDALREHIVAATGDAKLGSYGRLHLLRSTAESACISAAVTALAEATSAADVVETARVEFVDELEKLAPTLDGIGSADEAIAGGRKTAEAWSRLVALEDHRVALARCWSNLATLGVVDRDARPFEFAAGTSTVRLVRRIEVAA